MDDDSAGCDDASSMGKLWLLPLWALLVSMMMVFFGSFGAEGRSGCGGLSPIVDDDGLALRWWLKNQSSRRGRRKPVGASRAMW